MRTIYFISLILSATMSLSAQADQNWCRQFWGRSPAVAIPLNQRLVYTPPARFWRGYGLARQIVSRIKIPASKTLQHLEFSDDPRFLVNAGFSPSREPLDLAFTWARNQTQSVELLEVINFSSEELKNQHSLSSKILFTWHHFGLPAMNLLMSHQSYVAELSSSGLTADGVYLPPVLLFIHDIRHAFDAESIFQGHQGSAWPFYRTFHYNKIASWLKPYARYGFDLGYFLFFHERLGSTSLGSEIAQMKGIHSPQELDKLQNVYRSNYRALRFEFTSNQVLVTLSDAPIRIQTDGVTVQENFVDRFLDKNDLWGEMPLSVRRYVESHPTQARKAVARFLDWVFTNFFTQHYRAAKLYLGIHDSVSSAQLHARPLPSLRAE